MISKCEPVATPSKKPPALPDAGNMAVADAVKERKPVVERSVCARGASKRRVRKQKVLQEVNSVNSYVDMRSVKRGHKKTKRRDTKKI